MSRYSGVRAVTSFAMPGLAREEATFCIGGIRTRLYSPGRNVLLELEPASFAFLSNGPADISLTICHDEHPHLEQGAPFFDNDGKWALHRTEAGITYVMSATDPNDGTPAVVMQLSHDLDHGAIFPTRPLGSASDRWSSFGYPTSELLAILMLARQRGVLLHAVGVNDNGRGDLFWGVSGAGKSTTARLWYNEPGVEILSDDRIIVRKHENRFWMYGTPWNGEFQFASPGRLALERLFLLAKGRENRLRRLTVREAMRHLTLCCFATFWDPEGMAFTLSFLSEIAASLPCYELTFVNDHSVVDFVRSL